MFFLRLAITALRSLDTHFLRSLLATLGVLIGVGSVVACMSILEGATNEIIRNLSTLGSQLLFVKPAVARVEGRPVGAAQTLTVDDSQTLLRELPDDVDAISCEAIGVAMVKYFQKSEDYTVIATNDQYFQIHDFNALRGRVISKGDAEDDTKLVVCLGHKVAETVKIRNTAYRVIGVLEQRGNIGFFNADECIYIPIKSGLRRFFNRRWVTWMSVQVNEGRKVDEVKSKVEAVLRRAHNIRVGGEDDFEIHTQEEVMRQVNEATVIFKIVFYSIAGISLLVGGIGIMNIMLVSVTERTREIGVRMAVGARRGDILLQFLVEALIISLVGGAFGLLLGMMFADLLDKILEGMFRTEITMNVVITALATITVVGVFSGLYPAFKASRLDPVEALRYE